MLHLFDIEKHVYGLELHVVEKEFELNIRSGASSNRILIIIINYPWSQRTRIYMSQFWMDV